MEKYFYVIYRIVPEQKSIKRYEALEGKMKTMPVWEVCCVDKYAK